MSSTLAMPEVASLARLTEAPAASAQSPLSQLLPTLHRQVVADEEYVFSFSTCCSDRPASSSTRTPNLRVSANVLFPLAQRRLTDDLTWMLGFD